MKKLSILVMILVAFFQGYAQNITKTLNYIVKVVNAEGGILSNAEIIYQNDKDKSLIKGFTNDQGIGAFSLVQGETYSLKIIQAGVTSIMQKVTVPMGNYADANMTYTIIPPRKAIVPEDNGPKKLTYFVHVKNFDGVSEVNAKVSYENVKDKKVLEGMTDAEGKVEIVLMQGQSYIPKIHQYDTIFVFDKIETPLGDFAGINMTYKIKVVKKNTNIPSQKTIVLDDDSPKELTYFVQVTNFDGIPEANAKFICENVKDKKVLEGITNAEGKVEITLIKGQSYIPKVYQYDTIFVFDNKKIEVPLGNYGEGSAIFKIKYVQKYTNIYTINVQFNNNDYSLGKEAVEILDKLAKSLQTTSHKFELAAHTDNVGSDADNMLLSQKRANSVRDYLIKKGVAANRLIAKGYGEKAPVADNGTAEGRAKNRRTEVRQIEKRPK